MIQSEIESTNSTSVGGVVNITTTSNDMTNIFDKKYSTDDSDDLKSPSMHYGDNIQDSGVDTEEPSGNIVCSRKDDDTNLVRSPRVSPIPSPSNSMTEIDTVGKHNAQQQQQQQQQCLYERNLLRKRLVIPEISFDYNSDDVKTDDEMRKVPNNSEKPVGREFEVEQEPQKVLRNRKKSAFRSKSNKAGGSGEPFVAALAVKKLSRSLRSPMFLRKSNSFKQADSTVSSSNETGTEHVEKRKKRKLSLGKRKKSQQLVLVEKKPEVQSDTENPSKIERPTHKYRRRKPLLKSQTEQSLDAGIANNNKSKVVLLYSGHATLKSPPINRKNRLQTLKHAQSYDSNSSDCDDYSSACSDLDNSSSKTRKQKRNLKKRFWKSINTLFLSEYNSSNESVAAVSVPPELKSGIKRGNTQYRSMPGDLRKDRVTNSLENAAENDCTKDDLDKSLLKQTLLEKLTLDSHDMKHKPTQMCENSRNTHRMSETKQLRSKSLDDLLDKSFTRRLSPEWFRQRKKAYSTATSNDQNNSPNLHGHEYKIFLSHEPVKHTKTNDNVADDHNVHIEEQLKDQDDAKDSQKDHATESPKDHVAIQLQSLKATLQREMTAFLSDKQFQPDQVTEWCRSLSDSMKEHVVHVTKDAFKVVVQVFIGALLDDGIHAAIQSTTGDKNNNNDGFFTVTYNGTELFAVASILTFEL